MKKILIICLISSFMLIGCSNKDNDNMGATENLRQITNLKESTKDIPKFTIVLKGLVEDAISEGDIKNLKQQKSHSRGLIHELDFSLLRKKKKTNKCTKNYLLYV